MDDQVEVAVKAAKKAFEESLEPIKPIPREDFFSSGSTLVDLACSGTLHGAFCKGKFFWMVGSSSSGKTWLTLNALAEAAINPNFKEYDLVYNNAEDGALMDVQRYFGKSLAMRLRPPSFRPDGSPRYSRTVEEFYYQLDDRLTQVEKGKAPPFVELLDSFDALSSDYEAKKFKEHKRAHDKKVKKEDGQKEEKEKEEEEGADKSPAGDYGDGKAKIHSRHMRGIIPRLRDTGSVLIGLSQERDNIGGGVWDPANVVAGGRALKFYATWQLWSALGSAEFKSVNNTNRQVGITSKIHVKKNRLSGKEWKIEIPIYWSYGIDEIGSLVDFLVKEGRFKQESKSIVADIFGFKGLRERLIKKIEDEDLLFDLRQTVLEEWKAIEAACELQRKPRYT